MCIISMLPLTLRIVSSLLLLYVTSEVSRVMHCRRALEAKAALYDRLCGGEGVRGGGSDDSEEEGGEGRYMVDFTRKIVEEVCVCMCHSVRV